MTDRPEEFAQALLRWACSEGRSGLPWQPAARERADPYRVWVSEVMLQQTQVKTMLPYFERFIGRFPTVQRLSEASLQEVLSYWSGLGYYARARNLHRAAKSIAGRGDWPQTRKDWEQLPGVGRSTAAAIVSIVWGAREAILDGNVRRVLARQVCAEPPWGSASLAARLWPEAEARLPTAEGQMPQYTQAMMDLGALVCLPKGPRCGVCPVRFCCRAAQNGRQHEFPVPALRRRRPERTEHWALLVRATEVFLQERPSSGLWGGLWCLPSLPEPPSASALWGQIRHSFTHFELSAQVWSVQPSASGPGLETGLCGFWIEVDAALAGPLPSPVRSLLQGLSPSLDLV